MHVTILKIRLFQSFRVLKEIGIIRAVFLISFLAFIFFIVYQNLNNPKDSYETSIIAGIIILMIHASRNDKRFIQLNFTHSYSIFLVEYLFLSLPVIILSLVFKNWGNAIILFLVCLMVSRISLYLGLNSFSTIGKILLNPFHSNTGLRINIKVPIKDPRAFEWISGFRRYFIIIGLVYLIVISFAFKAYVAPVGIILLSLLISGFYYYGESREFIELFSKNYKTFLRQKILLNLKYLFILLSPIIAVSLIFQIELWYYTLWALFIGMLIQIITIIFKYALFSENTDMGRNGIVTYINIIGLILPFFWPLPIIMGTRYYFKAQRNLKNILE